VVGKGREQGKRKERDRAKVERIESDVCDDTPDSTLTKNPNISLSPHDTNTEWVGWSVGMDSSEQVGLVGIVG
jgi:hypothetical protein